MPPPWQRDAAALSHASAVPVKVRLVILGREIVWTMVLCGGVENIDGTSIEDKAGKVNGT